MLCIAREVETRLEFWTQDGWASELSLGDCFASLAEANKELANAAKSDKLAYVQQGAEQWLS